MHPGKTTKKRDNRVWPVVKKTIYTNLLQDTVLKHILTVPNEDTAAATTS